MEEQLDKTITFFENELEQRKMMLKWVLNEEYREYVETLVSYYETVLYALNELL